jgi:hypothetical protein
LRRGEGHGVTPSNAEGGTTRDHGVTPSNAEGGTTRDHGVTPSNAEGGTTRDVVLVLDGDVEVVLWRMDGMPDPDLWVVDALARLQLAARQVGGSIRLRNPCERLRALLDFVGLSEVLPDVVIDCGGASDPAAPGARPALPLEAGGEPEGGEQFGVEEVVDRRDPSP